MPVRNVDRLPLLDILIGHIVHIELLRIIDQYSCEDERLNVFIFASGSGYRAREMNIDVFADFTQEDALKRIKKTVDDNDYLIEKGSRFDDEELELKQEQETTLENKVYKEWDEFAESLPEEASDFTIFELIHVQFEENEKVGKVVFKNIIELVGTG
jgi:hypothetical protein